MDRGIDRDVEDLEGLSDFDEDGGAHGGGSLEMGGRRLAGTTTGCEDARADDRGALEPQIGCEPTNFVILRDEREA